MRVLMIAPEPFFEPRGTPFSILNRLSSLTKRGVRVDLVTYPIGFDPGIDGVTVHRPRSVWGIKSVPVGFSFRKLILDLLVILKARRLLKRYEYDLVHTHEEAGLIGNWLSGHYGIKHLYDMHSNLLEQMKKSFLFRRGPLHWIGEKMQNSALRNADGVITICPELQNYVDRVAPDVPHVLIENTYDYFAEKGGGPDAAALRAKFGLTDETVLLYAGTFEDYQGLDIVIKGAKRVVEKHPNVRYVMVGGRDDQIEDFRAMARAEGVESAFLFPGIVAAEVVPGFVEMATLLLSPRIRGTNTPSKIYTYLRSGRPMVATELETHTQVLNDEVAMLTDVTPAGFADGILALLDEPEKRRAIGKAGVEFAAERYDAAFYHENLAGLYRTLADAGRPHASLVR